MSEKTEFPGNEWTFAQPGDVGISVEKLDTARAWHAEQAGDKPYRVVIVRGGRIAAEWEQGTETDAELNMASATKSLFSSVLGIAIAEGKIASADDKATDYYPEMLDVPEGRGPKPGRFVKPEDRDITLRQLICNTSGYMKPGESPGKQFHYQTYGMNVCCHAIEMAYRLYDSGDPDRLPGIGKLIEEKIRNPIGGKWGYRYTDFEHPPQAVKHIFGHSPRCDSSARDMARMGLLWLHFGKWVDTQVIPEDWMREATRTAPDILASCTEDQRRYGHAFWTNDHGLLWGDLPRSSFAASGAGRKHIFVCGDLDLVVAQSPGIHEEQDDEINRAILGRIVDSCH
jgi:CubicO group peptidase (beta-lactamase class C family)